MSLQVPFISSAHSGVHNVEDVALPGDVRVTWSATYGASFWAITTKIDTEDAKGNEQSYFMKVRTPRTVLLGWRAEQSPGGAT
jgi:hypothetical protein